MFIYKLDDVKFSFSENIIKRDVIINEVENTIPICIIICNGEKSSKNVTHDILFKRQLTQVTVMLKSLVFFSHMNFRLILLTDSFNTSKKAELEINTLSPR